MKFIFLAAGRGTRIYNEIRINKCLIEINKKTIISKLIENIPNRERNNIAIVLGFNAHKIKNETKKYNVQYILNKKFKTTEMLYSAYLALKKFDDDLFFSYTDIVYNKIIVKKFIKNKFKKITIPINLNWLNTWKLRGQKIKDDAETLRYKGKKLTEIGGQIKRVKDVQGQFMGIFFIPKSERKKIIKYILDKKYKKKQITYFLNSLINNGETVEVFKYRGNWYEIDNIKDLKQYQKYLDERFS